MLIGLIWSLNLWTQQSWYVRSTKQTCNLFLYGEIIHIWAMSKSYDTWNIVGDCKTLQDENWDYALSRRSCLLWMRRFKNRLIPSLLEHYRNLKITLQIRTILSSWWEWHKLRILPYQIDNQKWLGRWHNYLDSVWILASC